VTIRQICVLIGAAATSACADPRQDAVESVAEFAQAMPYTIGAPESEYLGYKVMVSDEHLAAYNAIFTHFDPGDSSRTRIYKSLPEQLLLELPITRVHEIVVRETATDTAIATITFDRPERQLFLERMETELEADTFAHPAPERVTRFNDALRRARGELQQVDTARVYLTGDGRIVGIRTASFVRDSVVRDSAGRVARGHLERLVQSAVIRVEEVSDRSALNLGIDGASVRGVVDPKPIGWFSNSRLYVSMVVQCEGRRGDDATTTDGYVRLREMRHDTPDDFLCLWSGRDGREWTRVRPSQIRVRLMGIIMRDTIAGPWVQVR
jgi:hypothetical protein